MISAFLRAACCGLKLILCATILYFMFCIFVLVFVGQQLTNEERKVPSEIDFTAEPKPSQILALGPDRERKHNQTLAIQNDILITPAPQQKQKQSKAKQQPLPQASETEKPLAKLTSKELLALAKKMKIKRYSAIYRAEKKPGLLRLIEEHSIA